MKKLKIKINFFVAVLVLISNLHAQTPFISNQVDTIRFGNDTIWLINRTSIFIGDKIFNDLITYTTIVNNITIESSDKIVFDTEYSENGNIINIDGNIGVIKKYYSNGQFREIYTVVFGRKIDYYVEFHSNGKVKTLGKYKLFNCLNEINFNIEENFIYYDDEIVSTTVKNIISVKTGDWHYFDQDGKIEKILKH